MKITITEIANQEFLMALGVQALLSRMGIGVDLPGHPGVSEMLAPTVVAPVPLAALPTPAAAPRARRTPAPKPKPKPKAKAFAAASADPRGSKRDAIRAALRGEAKTIEQIIARVQKTFPELNRDYIGTVLCQLSKAGECSLGDDKLWRAAA